MKLWGGRFTGDADELMERFNASLGFDKRLIDYDIEGSIAHAEMLGRQGIIPEADAEEIIAGLQEIREEFTGEEIEADYSLEDVHTFVEKNLIEKIGQVGGKLHTGRSRNDQVALDMRLYLREAIDDLQELLRNFMDVLLDLAGEHAETIMPGYTHLQRAQPVTFGHHLLAYYFKLKRDYERLGDCRQRVDVLPLGSGALAGTSFSLDREWVAEKLGFASVSRNSLDAVSDRDFLLEFLGAASTLMMHLSRLSEEIVLWSSSEFSFIELEDAYTTGSSIMPQKKNPDVAELVRGKTGRIYGSLLQLLTVLKGLPLAYNKDLQEDKEGVFETVDTLKVILQLYPRMLATMEVKKDVMREAAAGGYANATELANYLVRQDISFRRAHEMVGKAVLYCLEQGLELTELGIETWGELFPAEKELFTGDISRVLEVESCVQETQTAGGPAPAETERIVKEEREWLRAEKV